MLEFILHPDVDVQATGTYMKTHYKRNLPHILPPGEIIFITYRLTNSIPAKVLQGMYEDKLRALRQISEHNTDDLAKRRAEYNEHKRYFSVFDTYLDSVKNGPDWLKIATIATIVKESLHHKDGEEYNLYAYCVMPNHVHLLLVIRQIHRPFYMTLKSIKGFSARRANELLDRTGQPFWQAESYDHIVRSQKEFDNIIAYILNNPVKAGLVDEWNNWPHSYLANNLL